MEIQTKWTSEVEELLEKLRINCVNLSEYHRKRYYHFKGYGKYFRLPLIVLASINATASVGLQPLLEQQLISGITCLIGMTMGILGAVELYLGIQANMELELKQSKEFYTLSIDLFKTLSLRRENRAEDGKDYLNRSYSDYIKLKESSNLLRRRVIDTLTEIPPDAMDTSPLGSNADMNEFLKDSPFYKESEQRQSVELHTGDVIPRKEEHDTNEINATNATNEIVSSDAGDENV